MKQMTSKNYSNSSS